MKKLVEIPAIEYGTVIDHIPSDVTIKAMEILADKLQSHTATMGINFQSKRQGKKGVIKIEGTELSQKEANQIAILAPHATLNVIKDSKVVRKGTLSLPEWIEGILKCPNPECITNHERAKTRFRVLKDEPLNLRCNYCERSLRREDLIFE